MELSNVRKKQGTTKCDKSTIIYDISASYDNGNIKYEKNKGTIEFDKSTVTCDVNTK